MKKQTKGEVNLAFGLYTFSSTPVTHRWLLLALSRISKPLTEQTFAVE